MYLQFFGFSEKPFNLTPDPRFLFLSEKHKEALGHLLYGIRERKGFIVITGEVGTGKTILSRALLHHLAENGDVKTALILNPTLSEIELLKTINEEFGIPSQVDTKKELIDELNNFLIDQLLKRKNAALIIDESQNLTPSVLEQIRLLSNLETEKEKLLQIILMGQSELEANLQLPRLRQLNQRIAVRFRLSPLSFDETNNYIYHRLTLANGQHKIKFSRPAMEHIFSYTQGNPRKINMLADRLLIAAYAHNTVKITAPMVKRTLQELRELLFSPLPESHSASTGLFSYKFYSFLAIFFFIMALTAGYLYRNGFVLPNLEKTDSLSLPVHESARTGEAEKSSLTQSSTEKPAVKSTQTNEGPLPVQTGRQAGPPETEATTADNSGDKDNTSSNLSTSTSNTSDTDATKTLGAPNQDMAGGKDTALNLPIDLPTVAQGPRSITKTEMDNFSPLQKNQIDEPTKSEETSYRDKEKMTAEIIQPSKQVMALWPLKENLEWLKKGNISPKYLKLMAQAYGFHIEEIETIPEVLKKFKSPFFIELVSPLESGDHFLLLDRVNPQGKVLAFSSKQKGLEYPLDSLESLWNRKALIPIQEFQELFTLLKPGMKGEQVGALQANLKELNYLSQVINSNYDENTIKAVKDFQKNYLLDPDGYAGPKTKLLLFLITGKL